MKGLFEVRKQKLLAQLDVPDNEYNDYSPKGSIDEPIRALINEINRINGLVTTSSCSGRISVFLEGRRKNVARPELSLDDEQSQAGSGGKGGGSWLFVSHSPVDIPSKSSCAHFISLFRLLSTPSIGADLDHREDKRYIHVKFEPMILHILTATLEDAQCLLHASSTAGFRESGAMGLKCAKDGTVNPMVAIRSTGFSFDAIVGYQNDNGENVCTVDESHLRTLVGVANERFKINTERIERFRSSLLEQYSHASMAVETSVRSKSRKSDWEDSEARRLRKKEEGLQRQRALRALHTRTRSNKSSDIRENVGLDDEFQ